MKLWERWDQLPEDLRKAMLVLFVVYGGTSVSCRNGPVVCDPAPPPSLTPMICDPPPPPSVTPGPPPVPTVTLAPGQHFSARIVQRSSDASVEGAVILGTVVDEDGLPLGSLSVVVERDGWRARSVSDREGAFSLEVPEGGTYSMAIEGDEAGALGLTLALHDVVTVEWVETWEESRAPLPLAEIRTVGIVWEDGLSFGAETPWPGARYRWSVSGGRLIEANNSVVWQPPEEPGRYLLQVVAEWGRMGLAVDAAVLIVEDDGGLALG